MTHRMRDAGTPLEGLRGEIVPPAISPFYRLGLAAVLLLLVLLPLVYIGLMAGVAWLTWFHATHNWPMLAGRGGQGRLLIFFAPLVAGVLMLLFMIKPILARRETGQAPVLIRPDQEPLLFAFIARICHVLKAPVPSEVALDCQVNASASFRRGLLSFAGHDLTLTIGLPLVAGLTLQELAGVLAHELGHFAQGAGMRATYLIRTINAWFARVVYERDAWDTRLERLKRVDFRLTLVIWVAQAGIWMNRKILHGLMMIGHASSCFMLRQMEYDADRYEVELSGTDTFVSTSEKMPVLNAAFMQALDDARNGWRVQRLPDDLPALMLHRDALLSPSDRDRVLEQHRSERTGSLDTHPTMRDRIEAARRLARPGLFRGEAPATVLFRDFEASSRTVTRQYYEEVGVAIGQDATSIMVATSRMAADATAARAATDAYDALFASTLSPYRPLTLPSVDLLVTHAAGAAPVAIHARFQVARDAVRGLSDRARAANEVFHEALAAQHLVQRAGVLIAAGVALSPAEWQIPESTTAGVRRALDAIAARMSKQKGVLDELDREAQAALVAALELIAGATEAPLAAFRAELPRLLLAFAGVSRSLEDLLDISVYSALLHASVQSTPEQGTLSEADAKFLWELVEVLEPMLQRVDAAYAELAYPFDTATGEVTLRQYVFGHDLPDDRLLNSLVRATRLVDVVPDLYVRLLGRFAQMALVIDRTAVQPVETVPAAHYS